jgi:hypothetical protein
MIAEMKTAAYLCTGCGLSEALDIGQLEKIAQKEGGWRWCAGTSSSARTRASR